MTRLSRRLAGVAVAALLACFAVLACNWPVSSAERAVYDAALSQLRLEDDILGIERRTSLSDEAWEFQGLSTCFPQSALSPSTTANFEDANRLQRVIPRAFAERHDLILTSAHGPLSTIGGKVATIDDPVDCLTSDVRNHVRFSRVGFAPDHGSALVFVDFHCALCSYGAFVLFRWDRDSWTIADECVLWVS